MRRSIGFTGEERREVGMEWVFGELLLATYMTGIYFVEVFQGFSVPITT